MKLKNYVFAALALSIMSGCSEDEITGNGTDGNQTEANNKAYISVKINLPTGTSTTRAGLEEKFDNGIEDEWKVKDVTLLFLPKEMLRRKKIIFSEISLPLWIILIRWKMD